MMVCFTSGGIGELPFSDNDLQNHGGGHHG